MVKVRNISNGPRGLWVKGAQDVTYLDTSKEWTELDIDAGELESARKSGWFEIQGQAAPSQQTQTVSLQDAVADLDNANDEHWTQGGKPSLEHLAKVTGGEVKRADVDALGVERKK